MESPIESWKRKFPTNDRMCNHYISILEWLLSKWKPHKIAIKIAYHHTINANKNNSL